MFSTKYMAIDLGTFNTPEGIKERQRKKKAWDYYPYKLPPLHFLLVVRRYGYIGQRTHVTHTCSSDRVQHSENSDNEAPLQLYGSQVP